MKTTAHQVHAVKAEAKNFSALIFNPPDAPHPFGTAAYAQGMYRNRHFAATLSNWSHKWTVRAPEHVRKYFPTITRLLNAARYGKN